MADCGCRSDNPDKLRHPDNPDNPEEFKIVGRHGSGGSEHFFEMVLDMNN